VYLGCKAKYGRTVLRNTSLRGGQYRLRHPACLITINVPVVFMARYVMVLRVATSLLGVLEGVGPENRDFFGP
jgi:hypothetical protein